MKVTVIALAMMAFSSLAQAERQPAMEAALKNLQEARQNLEQAAANKGGHRGKAIDLIDKAIQEVRAGIQYANRH